MLFVCKGVFATKHMQGCKDVHKSTPTTDLIFVFEKGHYSNEISPSRSD